MWHHAQASEVEDGSGPEERSSCMQMLHSIRMEGWVQWYITVGGQRQVNL